MLHPNRCFKCGGRMSEGFMPDLTYGGQKVVSWVEGEPKKSFWVGVNLKGTKPLQVTTFRCDDCGFLESYAPAAN